MSAILTYFQSLPLLELLAMTLSFAYVILAAKGSLWCWPAAFIGTALYAFIFYDVQLLMDSVLQVYYLLMAIYGFWAWQKHRSTNNEQITPQLMVISWPKIWHVKVCFILTIISFVLGYVMANYTDADFPYIDAFTTVFAVFSTYLVAQRVLENWLYWIIIDFVSIFIYFEKDLLPTANLFIAYVIIAIYGYYQWHHIYKKDQSSPKVIAPDNA
ncbi:MAG: nicotinamide riboside transporter PnuC [Colwellia sp.]